MAFKFKGEDLVMLLLPELESHQEAKITFGRLNNLREKLREQGAIYDLGMRELESLRYNYPENIAIEHTEVRIIRTKSFVNFFEMRVKTYDRKIYNIYQGLWEETK